MSILFNFSRYYCISIVHICNILIPANIYSNSSFGSVIIITCRRPHPGALSLAGHSWPFRRKTTLVGCIPGLIKNNACKSQVSKGRASLVIPVIMVFVATGLLVRCDRQGDCLVPRPARRWHLQLQIMILSRNTQIEHCQNKNLSFMEMLYIAINSGSQSPGDLEGTDLRRLRVQN